MKTPKPGQFCTINGVVYRAKKRESLSCYGCALNSPILCPNIVDIRNGKRPLECSGNGIIFYKV